jgi:hypothetical protein
MIIKNNFKNSKIPLNKILLGLLIAYFVVFGLLMVHTSGQPDQGPHYYFSQRFSETWGIPEEEPNSRFIVTGQPYLYYWINGAVYKIYKMIFPASQIESALIFRLISVFYAVWTVIYTYKLTSKVTGNPYAGILSAFFLSNTLMFVFVSGGISYDNLMNLAAVAAIYHLVKIYNKDDFVKNTALTGIWVIIGSLAKDQYLLLTSIIFVAWLYFSIRNLRKISLNFNKKNIILILIFIVFLALFLNLYGKNLLVYNRITPSCSQIKKSEVCRTYDYRYDYYEPLNFRRLLFIRDDLSNPFNYAVTFWIPKMLESIWGILSHVTFVPRLSVSLHGILILWSCISFFYYAKNKNTSSILLSIILLTYCSYVFLWNYKNELEFSFQHFVITGRYLLPILSTLLTLMTYSYLKIHPSLLKRMTLALAIIIYYFGGLGMFFSRYSEVFAHWRLYF